MKKKTLLFLVGLLVVALAVFIYIYKSPQLIADKNLSLKSYSNNGEPLSDGDIIHAEFLIYKKRFFISNPQYYATLKMNDETARSVPAEIDPNNTHYTMVFYLSSDTDKMGRRYYYFETPTDFKLDDAIFHINNNHDRLQYVAVKNADDSASDLALEFYSKYRK